MTEVRTALKSVIFLALAAAYGCATTDVESLPPLPEPPKYLSAPHPHGPEVSDVHAIFVAATAPQIKDLKECTSDFDKLRKVAASGTEIRRGAQELVRLDPLKYHWCFYSKIVELDEFLRKDTYWSQRQQKVLDSYFFLVPVAKAFKIEYQDGRYLRVATHQYRKLSEWIFYRRLAITPEASVELVEGLASPFPLWKQNTNPDAPILEKYRIIEPGAYKSDFKIEKREVAAKKEQPSPEKVEEGPGVEEEGSEEEEPEEASPEGEEQYDDESESSFEIEQ